MLDELVVAFVVLWCPVSGFSPYHAYVFLFVGACVDEVASGVVVKAFTGFYGDTEEVVKSFGQIHRLRVCLHVCDDVELIVERGLELSDVQEGWAFAGFGAEEVAEQVFVKKCVFTFGVFDIVKGIFVGFDALVFDDVGESAISGDGFGVFPVFCVDGFLDTGFEGGIKMVSHLDEDVFAFAPVLAIQIDDSMTGSTGSRKII